MKSEFITRIIKDLEREIQIRDEQIRRSQEIIAIHQDHIKKYEEERGCLQRDLKSLSSI